MEVKTLQVLHIQMQALTTGEYVRNGETYCEHMGESSWATNNGWKNKLLSRFSPQMRTRLIKLKRRILGWGIWCKVYPLGYMDSTDCCHAAEYVVVCGGTMYRPIAPQNHGKRNKWITTVALTFIHNSVYFSIQLFWKWNAVQRFFLRVMQWRFWLLGLSVCRYSSVHYEQSLAFRLEHDCIFGIVYLILNLYIQIFCCIFASDLTPRCGTRPIW